MELRTGHRRRCGRPALTREPVVAPSALIRRGIVMEDQGASGSTAHHHESVPAVAVVKAATLGALGGCLLGAIAGAGGALPGVDTPSGLVGLAVMFMGLLGAVAGILLGGFVGYWMGLERRGSPPNRVSLGLLAVFLMMAGVVAVGVTGAPPPLDWDPVWEASPWYALAVIVVPAPAALLADRLGARSAS